jgi:zinc/manganese transport system substrate-binding protein
MIKFSFILVSIFLSLSGYASTKLRVSSLHPIATDWLQQIGGEQVEVFAIAKHGDGFDPHRFKPSPNDIRVLESSQLIFAMGKNLETYLEELRDSLRSDQQIVEIGRTIPSQKVDADPIYACCPTHSLGSIDPHWWHNVRYAERAARAVASALAKADPANKAIYQERGTAVAKELRKLHLWVKSELSTIPSEQRILVTAHAAFAYFCKEYGFEAHYVQGLDKAGEIPAKQLATTIRQLRRQQIRAIFSERNANPKMLSQIAEEVGCRFGQPLDAEGGAHDSYEAMIQQNITRIVNALRP